MRTTEELDTFFDGGDIHGMTFAVREAGLIRRLDMDAKYNTIGNFALTFVRGILNERYIMGHFLGEEKTR